jgi:hypothetical protein
VGAMPDELSGIRALWRNSCHNCHRRTARLRCGGRAGGYQYSALCYLSSGVEPVNIRKIVSWIFLVFLVFFIVSNPTKAASVSHNIWHGVTVAAQGASAFVDDL